MFGGLGGDMVMTSEVATGLTRGSSEYSRWPFHKWALSRFVEEEGRGKQVRGSKQDDQA